MYVRTLMQETESLCTYVVAMYVRMADCLVLELLQLIDNNIKTTQPHSYQNSLISCEV